jgi:hypothetical protein
MAQGMVPRAELLAAAGEVKAAKEEARANASAISTLEEQLARAREQLGGAQSAMAAMVPEAELLAARARVEEADAQMRASGERHREFVEGLKEQARGYRIEIDNLKAALQVNRQTNSLIENSIEAGILLCGNGCRSTPPLPPPKQTNPPTMERETPGGPGGPGAF